MLCLSYLQNRKRHIAVPNVELNNELFDEIVELIYKTKDKNIAKRALRYCGVVKKDYDLSLRLYKILRNETFIDKRFKKVFCMCLIEMKRIDEIFLYLDRNDSKLLYDMINHLESQHIEKFISLCDEMNLQFWNKLIHRCVEINFRKIDPILRKISYIDDEMLENIINLSCSRKDIMNTHSMKSTKERIEKSLSKTFISKLNKLSFLSHNTFILLDVGNLSYDPILRKHDFSYLKGIVDNCYDLYGLHPILVGHAKHFVSQSYIFKGMVGNIIIPEIYNSVDDDLVTLYCALRFDCKIISNDKYEEYILNKNWIRNNVLIPHSQKTITYPVSYESKILSIYKNKKIIQLSF